MNCRHYLVFVLALLAGVLGACGNDGGNPGASETTDQTQLPADEQERGSVTIASAFLPQTLDPVSDGYALIQRGVAETLTRVTPDQSIEPWLAESVERVDDTNWEIKLRDDVVFWDGEPMTADHVAATFERVWDEQPAAARFLPESSELEIVDDATLRLTLPEPDSGLPYNLAAPQLVIHKLDAGDVVMTGPYRPVELRADEALVLASFDDYWAGQPPLTEITIKRMADGNARVLAVQSGDVDLITEASPEAASMATGEVTSVSVDSTRIQHVVLNHANAPFDDPAVRRAFNLGIDRSELNAVALSGLATPVTSMFPPNTDIPTPDQREFDPEQAATALSEAGWTAGDGGVRTKDGQPLEATLLTYPGRPDLTPMAVSIQDQLGRIGFDIAVQEIDDVGEPLEAGDFQASMYSMNMLPNGDPYYALSTKGTSDGIFNYGAYQNLEVDDVIGRIPQTMDPDERADLVLAAQELIAEDDAAAFLLTAPRVVMYRSDRLVEPQLHPSELYFIGIDYPRLAQ